MKFTSAILAVTFAVAQGQGGDRDREGRLGGGHEGRLLKIEPLEANGSFQITYEGAWMENKEPKLRLLENGSRVLTTKSSRALSTKSGKANGGFIVQTDDDYATIAFKGDIIQFSQPNGDSETGGCTSDGRCSGNLFAEIAPDADESSSSGSGECKTLTFSVGTISTDDYFRLQCPSMFMKASLTFLDCIEYAAGGSCPTEPVIGDDSNFPITIFPTSFYVDFNVNIYVIPIPVAIILQMECCPTESVGGNTGFP